jgi:predicted AlkP superfamily pyrophosphatase or phosphodiesterase
MLCVSCGAAQHPPPSARPRVVVTLVYDQLASWVLDRHLAHLDPAGGIRRTIARGTYVHRVAYDYAGTYTAPGHAAIYSGAPPWQSGIPSNRVWDRARRARVSSLDDGEHPLFGRPSAFASPERFAVESVADVLERESHGAAITLSIAMKDRSAVIPGGQHPDGCFWLDPRAGGFTTSSWYGDALPSWVDAFHAAHPLAATMAVWTPEDPAMLLATLGPDAQPGEGAYGFGATFPHDPSAPEAVNDPDAYLSTPASTEHLLAFAREAAHAMHVGDDPQTDLLAISIATPDYVGHAFGPESWEYLDALIRVDRAVGALLDDLEREHGELAVLITADHGIAPLVERSRAAGHTEAIRWTSEHELELLRAHLTQTLGAGAWIEAWVQPYVYLPATVRDGADRDRVVASIATYLLARPGIARVIDTRAAATLRASADPIDALIGRSIATPAPGEIYVVPTEWSVAEEELSDDAGTSHGSPWLYDREVPVIVSGPGVAHGDVDEDAISQSRVATTIAELLGVAAPALADRSSLVR